MKSSLQIASECVAFPRKLKSEVNIIHKTEICLRDQQLRLQRLPPAETTHEIST